MCQTAPREMPCTSTNMLPSSRGACSHIRQVQPLHNPVTVPQPTRPRRSNYVQTLPCFQPRQHHATIVAFPPIGIPSVCIGVLPRSPGPGSQRNQLSVKGFVSLSIIGTLEHLTNTRIAHQRASQGRTRRRGQHFVRFSAFV